jgi:hypothetical protein
MPEILSVGWVRAALASRSQSAAWRGQLVPGVESATMDIWSFRFSGA